MYCAENNRARTGPGRQSEREREGRGGEAEGSAAGYNGERDRDVRHRDREIEWQREERLGKSETHRVIRKGK